MAFGTKPWRRPRTRIMRTPREGWFHLFVLVPDEQRKALSEAVIAKNGEVAEDPLATRKPPNDIYHRAPPNKVERLTNAYANIWEDDYDVFAVTDIIVFAAPENLWSIEDVIQNNGGRIWLEVNPCFNDPFRGVRYRYPALR